MDKWYIGYIEQTDQTQIFASDDPTKATPEASGYDSVDGPFDTEEEAEANM